MGGTPARWRTLRSDAAKDPAWTSVCRQMDIVQPWTAGRYRTEAQAGDWLRNELKPDLLDLTRHGRLYMPVIFPGFSWHTLNRDLAQNAIPRNHGEFLKRQAQTPEQPARHV